MPVLDPPCEEPVPDEDVDPPEEEGAVEVQGAHQPQLGIGEAVGLEDEDEDDSGAGADTGVDVACVLHT